MVTTGVVTAIADALLSWLPDPEARAAKCCQAAVGGWAGRVGSGADDLGRGWSRARQSDVEVENPNMTGGDIHVDSIKAADEEAEDMRRPFLVGQKVYLRLLEESDIGEEYVGWLNDYEVTRYLETGKFPSTPEAIRKYLERFQDSTTHLVFAVVDRETDQHIGNVTLDRINWIRRTADTGLMIGRKGFWGKGYAFEAWSLIIEYAFQRLGLRKIIAGAVADNVASIAVLKKLGFRVEGTLRQEVLVDGEYRDTVRLGLLREEFYKCVQPPDSDSARSGP